MDNNIKYIENQIGKPNMIKEYMVKGAILGIILSIVNAFTLGFGGEFVFRHILFLFIRDCGGGADCWRLMIIIGSIFFAILTPLLFALAAYIRDKKNYAWCWKKIIILIFVFFLIILVNVWGFLEMELDTLLINNSQLIHRSNYKSIDECRQSPYMSIIHISAIGDCYGYFASKNNSIDVCYQIANTENLKDIFFKDMISSCMSVFSLFKEDINYCKDQKNNYDQLCVFRYGAIKGDKSACNLLNEKEYYKDKCKRWVNFKTYLILKYGDLRGGPSDNIL